MSRIVGLLGCCPRFLRRADEVQRPQHQDTLEVVALAPSKESAPFKMILPPPAPLKKQFAQAVLQDGARMLPVIPVAAGAALGFLGVYKQGTDSQINTEPLSAAGAAIVLYTAARYMMEFCIGPNPHTVNQAAQRLSELDVGVLQKKRGSSGLMCIEQTALHALESLGITGMAVAGGSQLVKWASSQRCEFDGAQNGGEGPVSDSMMTWIALAGLLLFGASYVLKFGSDQKKHTQAAAQAVIDHRAKSTVVDEQKH